jgi:FkbM family methyltransferase
MMLYLPAILRTSLERLSRGHTLKRRIYVNGRPVDLLVSPDAQLKYLKIGKNAFDADLISIAERYLSRESVVWDIGANVGVFTFAAAAVADKGTVIAVEADIWLGSLLRRSCGLTSNRDKDIRILSTAISSTDSIATFLIAKRGRASNALEEAGGYSQMGGVRERHYVPTLTLDTLLNSIPAPHFVKIDIEGAELMALQGADKLINHIRPLFYIEVGQHLAGSVMSIFRNAGYTAVNTKGDTISSIADSNTFFTPDAFAADGLISKLRECGSGA